MNTNPRLRHRAAVAAACLLWLIAGNAFAKETWVRIQSRNFILVSNAGQSDARKVILKLEQFRSTLSIIFPRTKLETPTPTLIILFKNDDDFRPFKPRVNGKLKEDVGGYFLSRSHQNYVVLAANIRGASPYEIIFHEYEHYVLHNNTNRLPVWLDEGLAEFFSSFTMSDDDQKATLGNPITRHLYNLKDKAFVPIRILLTVDHKSPYYNESSKAGKFYAESWGLVHYLMLGENGKHRSQLQQFLNSLSEDRPIEELFKNAFMMDPKQLDTQLQSYLNQMAFPILNATFSDKVAGEQEMTTNVLSEAEAEYYLGDLALQMFRPQDAEKHLAKSLELDAALSPAEAAMGILRFQQQKPDEARKFLRSAIEHDPNHVLAHYYLGRLLLDDKNYDEAIKSYQEAVRLRPKMAFPYIGLGYAYRRANQIDDAIKTFEDGRRLNPREEYFYRVLANLQLERNQGQAAVSYATEDLRITGWQAEHAAYAAFVQYFGLRQIKKDADAQKSLDTAAAQLNTSAWPYPVVRYLKRSLTLQELIASAGTDNDQLTEAHAYAGLELSLNGERAAALEHLHWVAANGNKDFVEYPLALAEIARLEGSGKPVP